MATRIHPTAIVEPGAELAEGVVVGAYAFVGAQARLGSGTVLHHHACVEGFTQLGSENEVFPFAIIGSKTHDLKYQGGKPGLRAGKSNVFREYVTVHLATQDGEFTVLGNDNVILAYSHVAHDCIVGDGIVMSSHAALGGHVRVGDCVNIGWNAGIHQFCRLGSHCMIGACAKIVQDVPPFMIADGNPAVVRTINKIGLERRGFSASDISVARSVFKILYRENLDRAQIPATLKALPQREHALVASTVEFLSENGRGLSRPPVDMPGETQASYAAKPSAHTFKTGVPVSQATSRPISKRARIKKTRAGVPR